MADPFPYAEFAYLAENATEYGISMNDRVRVRRLFVPVGPGRQLSAVVWGDGDPDVVFLHGGRQNAHTWDTVALALDRPVIAVDLPGHGHSDGAAEAMTSLDPWANANDVATAVRALAPQAGCVVGMSLGGLTAIGLGAVAPELVRRLVLVDVLPGLRAHRAQHIVDFVSGPTTFDDLDELVARTAQANPTRSISSLRRGVLHNAVQLADGRWQWRWARHREGGSTFSAVNSRGDRLYEDMWDALASIPAPLLLVRGLRPDSVLGDEDEAELLRRRRAEVVHVVDAGHSVQGDDPVRLAQLIEDFVGLGAVG